MAGGFHIRLGPTPASPVGRHHAQFGAPVFDRVGVTIWSDEPVISLGDRGCIIGHLFSRAHSRRQSGSLAEGERDRIAATEGRALVADYWGGYVAVLVDCDGALRVFRDPSGLLPCYMRRDGERTELAGDVTQLADRGAQAVDFDAISRFLTSRDLLGRRTCLRNVEELIAGECFVVRGASGIIESYWSPWQHIATRADRSSDTAVAELRETLLDVIGSWASAYDDIWLGVSGGLDSSIVAAAVRAAGCNVHCLTLVGPNADGDETRYARLLTDALALPLIERLYELSDIDIDHAIAPSHPIPNASQFRQAIAAIHGRLAAFEKVGAHFSGNGGDGIFCGLRSALPFVDRFLEEGPRPQLTSTLRDLCDLTGADRMTVLRHAWDRYRRIGEASVPHLERSGISPAALARLDNLQADHPWLAPPDALLPGKRAHVAMLARSLRSLELYPRSTAAVHIAPLMSQPIVELCLSIPTWMWIAEGRDRAVARRAFADLLPEAIVRRTHKGGPGGFEQLIYRRHGDALRAYIRHGSLVGADIIDRDYLDLPEDPSWRGMARTDRLLAFAAAESWVRWWQNM